MQGAVDTLVAVISAYGLKVVGGILLLLGGNLAAKWAAARVRAWSARTNRIDETLGAFLSRLAHGAVLVFTITAVLNSFGVQTASFIAVLGALGLAVGMALQGTLGNVASGVVLLILRPVNVGDFIEAAGMSGTVKEIGLFSTQLDTPQGVRIIVPNGAIATGTVTNYAVNPTRRADMVFGIGYDDDMDRAMQIIRDVLQADPRVLSVPELTIGVLELADSAVNIYARPWVNRSDFWGIKVDTTKKVKEAFDENGISIPFPQRDLHLHNAA